MLRSLFVRPGAAMVGLSLVLSAPLSRAAEPTTGELAMAEALFRQGKDLLAQGRVSEACAKFAASQEIDPGLGTLLNLAKCHEQEGKTASAWAEFAKAADLAKAQGQTDRVEFAEQHRAAMEKRLSYLSLEVSAPSDNLEILLDGKPLSRSVWSAPLPVDPGEHRIEARVSGAKRWGQPVRVEPGPATVSVRIPPLGATSAAAPAPGPARAPHAPGGGLRAAGIVVGVVGVLGIAAGATAGALTFVKEAEADKICPGRFCSQEGLDLHHQAETAALISTIALPVGIAGVGAGVALLLVARSKSQSDSTPAPSAWVSPVVGPHAAGLAAGGVF